MSAGSGASSKRTRLNTTRSQARVLSAADQASDLGQNGHSHPSVLPSSCTTWHGIHNQHQYISCLDRPARPASLQQPCEYISEGDLILPTSYNDVCTSSPWNEDTHNNEEFENSSLLSKALPATFTDIVSGSHSERASNSFTPSLPSFSKHSRLKRQRAGSAAKHRKPYSHHRPNISPFSVPETLVTFTNKSLVTENLMKVYHDSLENALSCWLTERTCPYGSRSLPLNDGRSVDSKMLREWGPDWSNRICKQVFDLDRASATVRGDKPLSKAEDKAASNALNLAIMAFATQWSQSSARSRAKYQSFVAHGGSHSFTSKFSAGDLVDDDIAEEVHAAPSAMDFDRILQESCWGQARRAIQDATHIESFRVGFAHIIFALTQKPLSVDASLSDESASASTLDKDVEYAPMNRSTMNKAEAIADHHRLVEELESVIEHDGPPVFLEQGLRHIHSLKCRLDGLNTESWRTREGKSGADSASTLLTDENKKTIDLLYWLGIMFDTLSAAMHKRPLVVSDEDSNVHPGDTLDLQTSSNDDSFGRRPPLESQNLDRLTAHPTSKLWGSFFIEAQQPRVQSSPVRWPCPYEVAATT
jgi:hypothetical protein